MSSLFRGSLATEQNRTDKVRTSEQAQDSDQIRNTTDQSSYRNEKAVELVQPGEKPETPMTDLGDNLKVLNQKHQRRGGMGSLKLKLESDT